MKLTIELECPDWMKKVGKAALPLLAVTVAGAALAVPKTFTAGETLKATDLNDDFADVDARLTDLENAVASDPDCPDGYTRDASVTSFIVCKESNDEVVKVGAGKSAFWIDRYEASVWSQPLGTGTQYGATSDDYPSSFPDNRFWVGATPSAYAASIPAVKPSANLTWFQATAACRAAGKRLPKGEEWIAAARGTVDTTCNINTAGSRNTGSESCQSAWGTEDQIGNMQEWTQEWFAGTNNGTNGGATPWPTAYFSDATWGVTGATDNGAGNTAAPAAAVRGGRWDGGALAGVFTLDLDRAPSDWTANIGFRCVSDR